MSGVIKFFKSLVSAEPAAAKVVSKASELSAAATGGTSSAAAAPVGAPSASSSQSPASVIQAVKPHVPLIKFRKGGPAPGHSVISGSVAPGIARGNAAVSRGTIEDYQLPTRYHRAPLDAKEIDYINRGGPE